MPAKDELEAAVEQKLERGMTRERAVAAIFKADPELRDRLVAEANPDRDPPRRAA